MKKLKSEMREIEVVEDIICNKCGESCLCLGKINYEGIIEYGMTGGYGSKLGDSISLCFSICETCLADILKTFKINPLEEENDLFWENYKKSL